MAWQFSTNNQYTVQNAKMLYDFKQFMVNTGGFTVVASGDNYGNVSTSGDVITGYGTGAGGLGNTNGSTSSAWFVLKEPTAFAGNQRQWLFMIGFSAASYFYMFNSCQGFSTTYGRGIFSASDANLTFSTPTVTLNSASGGFSGFNSGTTATLSFSSNIVTLSGGSSFTTYMVGQKIAITNATNSNNNGVFTILSVPSASSVTFSNPLGATQASPATVKWNTSPLIGQPITITGATDPNNNGTFTINGVTSGTRLTYNNANASAQASSTINYITSNSISTGNPPIAFDEIFLPYTSSYSLPSLGITLGSFAQSYYGNVTLNGGASTNSYYANFGVNTTSGSNGWFLFVCNGYNTPVLQRMFGYDPLSGYDAGNGDPAVYFNNGNNATFIAATRYNYQSVSSLYQAYNDPRLVYISAGIIKPNFSGLSFTTLPNSGSDLAMPIYWAATTLNGSISYGKETDYSFPIGQSSLFTQHYPTRTFPNTYTYTNNYIALDTSGLSLKDLGLIWNGTTPTT